MRSEDYLLVALRDYLERTSKQPGFTKKDSAEFAEVLRKTYGNFLWEDAEVCEAVIVFAQALEVLWQARD